MWSTLVVASLYAGVALSAPIEQHRETENTAAQFPNWLGGRNGYEDDSWGRGNPWGNGRQDRYPAAYSAPQDDRRPGAFDWFGLGPKKNEGSFFAPAKPTCSPSSRGFMDYLPAFLGGGRGKSRECDSKVTKPAIPVPWKAPLPAFVPAPVPATVPGPARGFGGQGETGPLGGPEGLDDLDEPEEMGDYGSRGSRGGLGDLSPFNAAPRPLVGLMPSSAAPLPIPSPSPEPSSVLAPVPISSVAAVPKPLPQPSAAAPEPSPKSYGNRVPTLGASSAKAMPTSQAPIPAPSSQAIAPVPTAHVPKPLAISPAVQPQSSSIAQTPAVMADPVQASSPMVNHGLWQPQVAEPFQIILSGHPDVTVKLAPDYVNIFDLDLFNTPVSTIKRLRDSGKKVICYFSAGSSEDWRPDYKQLSRSDMGNKIAKSDKGTSFWEGERWLNIKNPNPNSPILPPVWKVMRDRVKLAAEKGCNAVDPDNTDGYGNSNGLGLTEQDSVNFMRFMAKEARGYNMSIGLKNSDSILPQVQDVVQFAVNEECAANNECSVYQAFLMSKPVFHIEYTTVKSGSSSGFGYDSASSTSSESSSLGSSNSAGLLSPASSASASGALTSAAPSSWLGSLGSWGSSSTSSASGTKAPASTAGTSSGFSLSSLLGGLGSWGSSSSSATKAPSSMAGASSGSSLFGFLNPYGKSSPSTSTSIGSTTSSASPSSWFGSWGSSTASAPKSPSITSSTAAPTSFLGSIFTGIPKGLGAIASGVGSLLGWKKPLKVKRDSGDTAEAIQYNKYCTPSNAPELGPRFSTVIKVEALDGWVRFCDGRVADTRITNVDVPSRGRSRGDRGDDSSEREEDSEEKGIEARDTTVSGQWNRAIRRRRASQ